MAIKNRYLTGLDISAPTKKDLDSDFGPNKNRDINSLNSKDKAGISNSYKAFFNNQFGSTGRFGSNEQRLFQSIITETIHINGITVRFMPRYTKDSDRDLVWNERPAGRYHRGYQMDMFLQSATGFEGEGTVMANYGIEFKEEVFLRLSIPKFLQYDSDFRHDTRISDTDRKNFARLNRPLEGDLIIIPFGRTSQTRTNQYFPKVFEITQVQTYNDGGFFALGDNFQFTIRAQLFELSGETLDFSPTVVEYWGAQAQHHKVEMDSDTGYIWEAKDSDRKQFLNNKILDITKDSDTIYDTYARNHEIQERAEKVKISKDSDNKVIVEDYTAKAFGLPTVLNNVDEI